uniref:Uncharacterized protein n=1 Tax=Oryza brachyantha TaxID=4533 RepID=J3ML51_ORYBR
MVLTNMSYYGIPLVSVMFSGHLGDVHLAGATLGNSWATVTGYAFVVRTPLPPSLKLVSTTHQSPSTTRGTVHLWFFRSSLNHACLALRVHRIRRRSRRVACVWVVVADDDDPHAMPPGHIHMGTQSIIDRSLSPLIPAGMHTH